MSKETEFTEWFDQQVKPSREGVYEIKSLSGLFWGEQKPWFSYWNGTIWHRTGADPDVANAQMRQSDYLYEYQFQWRGLTSCSDKAEIEGKKVASDAVSGRANARACN